MRLEASFRHPEPATPTARPPSLVALFPAPHHQMEVYLPLEVYLLLEVNLVQAPGWGRLARVQVAVAHWMTEPLREALVAPPAMVQQLRTVPLTAPPMPAVASRARVRLVPSNWERLISLTKRPGAWTLPVEQRPGTSKRVVAPCPGLPQASPFGRNWDE